MDPQRPESIPARLDPDDDDRKRALELVLTAPIGELEQLARWHFSLSALRRRRLERRDNAFRRLAAELLGCSAAPTGRELADTCDQTRWVSDPVISGCYHRINAEI
jgi:hypothetical protein